MVNGNEQKYWEEIGDVDNYLKNCIDGFIDSGIESVPIYTIINPDGEVSDTYGVSANGKYTFIIKYIDTGNMYQETVDVTNIDTSLEYYVYMLDNDRIYLCDKSKNPVDFQNAYIIYNGERIDITSCIWKYNDESFGSIGSGDVSETLWDMGIDNQLDNTLQLFELIKDEKSYFGVVRIRFPK